MLHKLSSPRKCYPLIVALLGIIALSSAYIAEYWLDMAPCPLCIYQRIPYAIILGLMLILAVVRRYHATMLLLSASILMVGTAIALYHVGIEWDIFKGPSTCTSNGSIPQTLEQLEKLLFNTNPARCDQPAIWWFGRSMAEWNSLYSFGCTIVALIGWRKTHGI